MKAVTIATLTLFVVVLAMQSVHADEEESKLSGYQSLEPEASLFAFHKAYEYVWDPDTQMMVLEEVPSASQDVSEDIEAWTVMTPPMPPYQAGWKVTVELYSNYDIESVRWAEPNDDPPPTYITLHENWL